MAFFSNLQDALANYAAAYAEFMFSTGKTASEVFAETATRFSELSTDAVNAALDFALQSRSAGAVMNRLRFDRSPVDSRVPVNPELPSQYRYTVTVRFRVEGDPIPQYRTVLIDSPTRLTRRQVIDLALQQTATYFSPSYSARHRTQPRDATPVSSQIDAVQRRA